MTEKNIFAHKLFLSLNISDFDLLFMWKLQPPEKVTPLFPANPSKSWGSVKPPLFENLVVGSIPPPPCRKGGGGVHTMLTDCKYVEFTKYISKSNRLKLADDLASCNYYSCLNDGNTNSSVTEEEVIFVLFLKEGTRTIKYWAS